jgi:hypothetical protein
MQSHSLREGQYYEVFIPGKILKIWFWNDIFVCLEKQPMAEVIGDGQKTIDSLITERAGEQWTKDKNWRERTKEVLNYYNISFKNIPSYGERQTVDIRYGSPVSNFFDIENEVNIYGELSQAYPDLDRLGRLLYNLIKPCHRLLAYSVDAILGKEGEIWILEANANPFIHPHLYEQMLLSLFTQGTEP